MASHDKKISVISDILKDEYCRPIPLYDLCDMIRLYDLYDIDALIQTERELEREFEYQNEVLLAQAERELEREAGYDNLPF